MSKLRQVGEPIRRTAVLMRTAVPLLALTLAAPTLAADMNGAAATAASGPIPAAAMGSAPATGAQPAATTAVPVAGTSSMPVSSPAPAANAPTAMPTSAPLPAASASTPTPAASPAPAAAEVPANRVRVIYLNDSDRERIVKELKQEVVQTARDDNWAKPNTFPDWVSRIRFSGDIMFRSEDDLYDHNNSNEILNFQAINSKGPVNIAPPASGQPLTLPLLDTTDDRFVPRLRVHINMHAQVADNMEAIFRFATGNTVNPGTSTVTVGDDFAKENFLLDRAYMNYQPTEGVALAAGRMANPWSTPTDMVWSKELAFDGLGAQLQASISPSTQFFATTGAFSVLSTDPNFPDNNLDKSGSHGDWLYGAQLGLEWHDDAGTLLRGAIAYLDFDNIQSQLSSPCYAPNTSVGCDTDNSVPDFVQKGNTMFAVRDLQLVNSTDPQYQLFGLASKFRLININGTYDEIMSGPIHFAVDLDYVKNIAFNRSAIMALGPVNNLGSCSTANCSAPFAGGNVGKELQLRVGYPKITEAGQWSAMLGYRDIESDAVVDAFNDQDFHLGGTNAKGYFVGGSLGFTHNAWLTARWLSATEDSGPPLAIDVFQLDINARF